MTHTPTRSLMGSFVRSRMGVRSCWNVFTWGVNSSDHYGLGVDDGSTTKPISRIAARGNFVCANFNDSFALVSNGVMMACGLDYFGELGVGGTSALSPRLLPVVVPFTGSTFLCSSSGASITISGTSIAIKGGQLWACGKNATYQYGNGSTTEANVFTLVNSDTDWSYVSCANSFATGIKGGNLYGWGGSSGSQLGTGLSLEDVPTTPTLVNEGGWTMVKSNTGSSAGIKNGNLYCWGGNDAGQIGDGTTTDRVTPKLINSGGWAYVSVGYLCAHGIKNGNLYGWGVNNSGQIGDGTTTNRTVPTLVDEGGWTCVSCKYQTAAGIKNGDVYVWGKNNLYEAGISGGTNILTPTLAKSGSFKMVDTGLKHGIAV